MTEVNVTQVMQHAKIGKITTHLPSHLRRSRAGSYQGLLFDVVIEDLQDKRHTGTLACRPTERAQRLNQTVQSSSPLRRGDVSAAHDGDPRGANFPGLIETVQYGVD